MEEPRTGWPWMKIILVVSLGLNLLIVGAIAGSRMSGTDGPEKRAGNDVGRLIGVYGRAFSDEDRRAIRREFIRRAPDLRNRRAQIRSVSTDILAALRSTPFDVMTLDAAIGRQLQAAEGMRDVIQDVLTQHVGNMTEAERLEFADRLEKAMRRKGAARK